MVYYYFFLYMTDLSRRFAVIVSELRSDIIGLCIGRVEVNDISYHAESSSTTLILKLMTVKLQSVTSIESCS